VTTAVAYAAKRQARTTIQHIDDDNNLTHMSHLHPLAERMGIDLFDMTAAQFADLYEQYTALWDKAHAVEGVAGDVHDAWRAHRRSRPNAAIQDAIQVGFAHGLTLGEVYAILEPHMTWDTFICGFMVGPKVSRLCTELDQEHWEHLEAWIHALAEEGELTYSRVRKVVRVLGSDVQSYAVGRLVGRFGYELQR